MEVVISLLMFLGDPPQLKEHLLMKNFSECLEKKRIATRNSNATFMCSRVKAKLDKDNKILKIEKLK